MGIESAILGPVLGAGISAGTSLIGANRQASAAQSAADTQSQAAKYAADAQLLATQLSLQQTRDIYNQNVLRAQPFVNVGQGAAESLGAAAGSLGAPLTSQQPNLVAGLNLTSPLGSLPQSPLDALPTFAPTMEQLAATPGYQFTLDQGLKATQNSYAAQGLGTSGAAMKGAARYAENLASTTYQQQFNNWLSQQNLALDNWQKQAGLALQNYDVQSRNLFNQASTAQNFGLEQNRQIYNIMSGLATLGANSAAGLGTQGIQAAGQQNSALMQGTAAANNWLTSGAAAQAAGTVAGSNAYTNALNSIGNNVSSLSLLYGMQGGGGGLFSGATTGGQQTGFQSFLGIPGYGGGGPSASDNALTDFGAGGDLGVPAVYGA